MYEFCYDFLKPKYGENVKLCYMHTDSFIVHVKTGGIYNDIAEDVEQDLTLQILNYKDHCLKDKI